MQKEVSKICCKMILFNFDINKLKTLVLPHDVGKPFYA